MLSTFRVCTLAAGAALLLLPATSHAQLNQQWVTFTKQPSKLAVSPLTLSDPDTQVLFRTADMDQDGWDDVVAVRKEQASQVGKRAAFLLMNINGVLTDKTAQLASASDVSHDTGFLTPTNTRECAIGDMTGDGWLDVVTAVTLSDGDPKFLSHPRVYHSLGAPSGSWLGLKYEDARVPQLKTVGGLAVAPRFCGMGLADVTGDGALDVYFVDYDGTETGIGEPANNDLNDRLLVNDGLGFFTDQSATRFTVTQLHSDFGADAEALDINQDGFMDIIKDSTLNNPVVEILYNNPAAVGNFTAMGTSPLGTTSPYGMDVGNLNNDNLLDVAIADDNNDKFRLGTGYDALNRVIWGPLKNFTFVNGGDDGFGHNVYIRDLDGDGWNDVLITDVDGDIPGCQRRLHIYHNTGSVPGDMNLVLKEEVELASGSQGAGWKGAVGITSADEKGSYDVGFGDFDKDGDLDLLIANCALGTQYFQNETNPVQTVCQTDMGFAGPGSMVFSICGQDLLHTGNVATMDLSGAAPSQPFFLPLALSAGPVPFKGGMLVPFPIVTIVSGLSTDGSGNFEAPVPGSSGSPVHVYMQCILKNGSTYEFSNALDCQFGV